MNTVDAAGFPTTVPREQWIFRDVGCLTWGAAVLIGGGLLLKPAAASSGRWPRRGSCSGCSTTRSAARAADRRLPSARLDHPRGDRCQSVTGQSSTTTIGQWSEGVRRCSSQSAASDDSSERPFSAKVMPSGLVAGSRLPPWQPDLRCRSAAAGDRRLLDQDRSRIPASPSMRRSCGSRGSPRSALPEPDDQAVTCWRRPRNLIIAHKATFDRCFLERRLPRVRRQALSLLHGPVPVGGGRPGQRQARYLLSRFGYSSTTTGCRLPAVLHLCRCPPEHGVAAAAGDRSGPSHLGGWGDAENAKSCCRCFGASLDESFANDTQRSSSAICSEWPSGSTKKVFSQRWRVERSVRARDHRSPGRGLCCHARTLARCRGGRFARTGRASMMSASRERAARAQ